MVKRTYKRKWRNFLIHNDIQLRLALHHLIFLLIVIGVVVVTALVPLYSGFQGSDNVWSQYFSAKFFIVIINRLMIASIGILIFGFIYHVIVTHRFCGPLVNFGHTFHQITQGNLTRKVYLRRKDFLKKEADQVNNMIDSLSRNINDIKQYNHLLQEKLEQLTTSDHELSQSEQTLAEIKKLADASGKALDLFKADEISHLPEKDQLAN
jgi:methyl-accepting chemotaxis protein